MRQARRTTRCSGSSRADDDRACWNAQWLIGAVTEGDQVQQLPGRIPDLPGQGQRTAGLAGRLGGPSVGGPVSCGDRASRPVQEAPPRVSGSGRCTGAVPWQTERQPRIFGDLGSRCT
jgi:hypothetical protein